MVAAPPFVYFHCENTLSFAGLSQLGLQVPNFSWAPESWKISSISQRGRGRDIIYGKRKKSKVKVKGELKEGEMKGKRVSNVNRRFCLL